jgi:hypothetical protein
MEQMILQAGVNPVDDFADLGSFERFGAYLVQD